jgi:hypothetical protein
LTSTKSVGGAKVGVDARARPARAGRILRNRQSAKTKLAELKCRLLEMNDLRAAGALLGWDHATYMPKYGAVARARQGATVSYVPASSYTKSRSIRTSVSCSTHSSPMPTPSPEIRTTRA